jgi:hypothetical protein
MKNKEFFAQRRKAAKVLRLRRSRFGNSMAASGASAELTKNACGAPQPLCVFASLREPILPSFLTKSVAA